MAIALGLVCGGLEALLILTLRVSIPLPLRTDLSDGREKEPYSRGVEWPMLLIGIVASILLAAGIVPIYVEIWKRGGRVIGISGFNITSHFLYMLTRLDWAFLSIDWLGGLFSLLALTQQGTFDTIGGVMYILL